MLELRLHFSSKFCVVNMFKGLETDRDSLYLALAWKELKDCIQPELKTECERLWSKDCIFSFTAGATETFFSRKFCDRNEKHDKREPQLFKKEFRCTDVKFIKEDVLPL